MWRNGSRLNYEKSETIEYEPVYGLPRHEVDKWLARNPQLRLQYKVEEWLALNSPLWEEREEARRQAILAGRTMTDRP